MAESMGRTEVEIQFGKSEIPPGEGGEKKSWEARCKNDMAVLG